MTTERKAVGRSSPAIPSLLYTSSAESCSLFSIPSRPREDVSSAEIVESRCIQNAENQSLKELSASVSLEVLGIGVWIASGFLIGSVTFAFRVVISDGGVSEVGGEDDFGGA